MTVVLLIVQKQGQSPTPANILLDNVGTKMFNRISVGVTVDDWPCFSTFIIMIENY